MSTGDLPPVHPGEQLREEFMKPLGISAYRLAKDLDVPVSRIQDLERAEIEVGDQVAAKVHPRAA